MRTNLIMEDDPEATMAKDVAAGIIYNNESIFLMSSDKWDGWVIPGGKREQGETEVEALIREIREELDIEITDIEKIGEEEVKDHPRFKRGKEDFFFRYFRAKAKTAAVTPNDEIRSWGWFEKDDALKLNLVPGVRRLLEKEFRAP